MRRWSRPSAASTRAGPSVCPRILQERRTSGTMSIPDSSRKTRAALRGVAFFIQGQSCSIQARMRCSSRSRPRRGGPLGREVQTMQQPTDPLQPCLSMACTPLEPRQGYVRRLDCERPLAAPLRSVCDDAAEPRCRDRDLRVCSAGARCHRHVRSPRSQRPKTRAAMSFARGCGDASTSKGARR